MTVRSLARDVRALGLGAPVRAAYEASKRSGGHRLVFGSLARRSVASEVPAIDASGFAVDLPSVPEAARRRAIKQADDLLAGHVVLFGQPVPFSPRSSTHAVIEAPGHWPNDPWWEVDIRSERRLGDVKWVWELGRSRHIVILARAAAVAGEERYYEALFETLKTWLRENPIERGVHWYSNLELCLRAFAWAEMLGLVGAALPCRLRDDLVRQLDHTGRHVVADLPYTVSTMRNNHLLGDALGLIALDKLFRGARPTWRRLGNYLFDLQLRRHMHDDGSMIEDSLGYHRFVLEMLIRRVQLAGPEEVLRTRAALVAGARFLCRLGALAGPVPQYGDWDEGRVLSVLSDDDALEGSVRLALAVAGNGAPEDWREQHDECAWYATAGDPVVPEPATCDGSPLGGGFVRGTTDGLTVWLKGGTGPSHGHADMTSVAVWDGEGRHWLIGDPGTGTYNGELGVRNYFRGSAAHSVLRVDGLDQLEPHRAFRWVHGAVAVAGSPIRIDGTVVMWAAHDAYGRLTPRRRIVRAVALCDGGVTVADWVEGAPTLAQLSVPLALAARWDEQSGLISFEDGSTFQTRGLEQAWLASGSEVPFQGWWSDTYGSWKPAHRLERSCQTEEPIAWAIGGVGVHASGGVVQLRDVDISVHWEETSCALEVRHQDVSEVREVPLPR